MTDLHAGHEQPVDGRLAVQPVRQPGQRVERAYHPPGRRSYAATDPEECFAAAADAEAAGYRPPRNSSRTGRTASGRFWPS